MHERPPLRADYDRVVNFYNPKGTNARALRKRLQTLASPKQRRAHKFDISTHRTEKNFDDNCEVIQKHIDDGEGVLIGVGGGDGTCNYMELCLMALGINNPVLFYGGGNGCDLPKSLVDRRARRNLTELLIRGRVEKLFPLGLDVSKDGYTVRRTAVAHTGINITGDISERMNHEDRRNHWLHDTKLGHAWLETAATLGGIKDRQPFIIEPAGSLEPMPAYELIVANTNRMGKIMHPQSNPIERAASVMLLPEESFLHLVHDTGRIILGMESGLPLGDGLRFNARTETGLSIPAHVDGEHFSIASNSNVHIWQHHEGRQVVTTR
jgi:diacylglycerol kinase family enzyme